MVRPKIKKIQPEFVDVRQWFDTNLDAEVVDLTDQKVYENVYHDGRFAATFQFTESGAQRFARRARPRSIMDIAAVTSIYRPGPLQAGVDEAYVRDKEFVEAGETLTYEHPIIGDVLSATYGHMCFQEHFMMIGNKLGGLSWDDCDKLRKILVKKSIGSDVNEKKAADAEIIRQRFMTGAMERGMTQEGVDALWEKMCFFNGYGFNASHAVSYALDSFMCAHLQTYHEAEWLSAYAEEYASDGPKKRARVLSDVRTLGYQLVPVDVNYAGRTWKIIPGKKMMPSFTTIKGIGDAAVSEILANRPYRTIYDLLWNDDGSWRHTKFNKRAMSNLISIGAFDSMGLVGEHAMFTNYRHMHEAVIDHWDQLRKRKGRELMAELSAVRTVEDWTREEKVVQYIELVGSVDLDIIIDPDVVKRLQDKGIPSVDDAESEDTTLRWFIVMSMIAAKTKKGKPYLKITCVGEAGIEYKMNIWGWTPDRGGVQRFAAYLGDVERSDWGLSCTPWKMKALC